jgi:carboxyl-terminal processing protease
MKIDKVYFPLFLFTVLAVGFVLGGIFVKAPTSNQATEKNSSKQKLNRLIDFIDSEYVEEVNTDSIVDQTVTGILEKLDPHSVYIAKNDADLASQDMRGNFTGIGVNFFIEKDTAVVINPLKGGPSEAAGIKAGDRILFADKNKLFGTQKNTDNIYKTLKGKSNSDVLLTIYRKSENKFLKIKVNRKTIPLKSVDIALMLKNKVGYIKINRFSESTYAEFNHKLNALLKKGATSLLLDLRDNSGGYMEEAIKITDDFLPNNKLIVFTKDKKGNIDKTFATKKGIFEKGKITILINENSASASEIIAGAIQDNDRGLIIGRRSFGKGLVQREMPFKDGSSVRLTVAKYYTPTGRSIQKSYENGAEDYFNDFMQRYHNGELYAKDSIKIADTLKFKTPKGRTVYGGGGIVPDVFVPIEATKGNEIIPIIMQSGLVMNFVFKTIDSNRKEFKNLNYSQIVAKTNTSDLYYELFKKQVQDSDAFINLDANKNYVKRYLTAEFCNQLLGEPYYYHHILKEDLMVKTALKN